MTTKTTTKGRKASRARAPKKLAALAPPPLLPDDVDDRVQTILFSLVDRWATHPGEGLTTRRIVSIFHEAERGYPAQQCDLFEDLVERDAHLRSQVESRIEAVAGKAWIVQASGDRPADAQAALLLEAALRQGTNFGAMLYHQLQADLYGYAPTEIAWVHRDGLTAPAWFINVSHRRIVFNAADEPRLLTDVADLAGVELEPGRWIFGQRPGARQTVRAGLMRTGAWWSLFKHMSVRDRMIYLARYGLPYSIGKYKLNASETDKAVLKRAVLSLGTDGAAIMSDSTEIEIKEVTHGSDPHGGMIALCNDEISKLIVGATLTSSTGGPGSFALGQVHANRSFDLTLGAAERLAALFELALGAPFVHFNGLQGNAPRLKIHVIRELDPKERAEIICMLAKELGLELDEDQIRQEFQLKQPTGGTLSAPKPTAAPAPGAAAAARAQLAALQARLIAELTAAHQAAGLPGEQLEAYLLPTLRAVFDL